MVFLLDNDNEVKSQVLSKLELSGNYRKGKLILKKPFYARRKKIDIMNPLDEDMFWGIKGSIRYFLNKLLEGNRGNTVDGNEGYFSEDKKYYITLDKEVLTKLKENYNNFSLFELLDDLRVAEMLDDIEMEIEKINGEYISISSLSEGEIQTVVFNGIIEIFKEKNCIFLLDEPDAFLHPEWQINLIDGLKDTNEKNHIIMSSHNPSTIVNSTDELIMCWKPLDKLLLKNVNKQFAMNTLSSGYYQLDEEEGILSILKKIQNEDKPVIFTEGITDKVILEISWNKLRRTPMPFLIVPMFSCNFLSKVLLDVNIQNQINNKMIGLFDFDEAYNEWNRVMAKDNSILLENNPYKGLTAKLSNKEVYSILLPVPDNELIKKQVIDCETSLTTFKYQSKLSIELLFFENFGIGEYFELVNSAGGKIVAFKNNSLKRKFSEEIIKDLEVEAFGVFDDLFNTIEEKIL
jgi:ABC-type Mn2+/Zn2+ transport system ATPase subunit